MDLILFWRELYTTSPPENTELDVKSKKVHFQAGELLSQAVAHAFPEV